MVWSGGGLFGGGVGGCSGQGGGMSGRGGSHPPRRKTRKITPVHSTREYDQCTVGTHPTGMHSCLNIKLHCVTIG